MDRFSIKQARELRHKPRLVRLLHHEYPVRPTNVIRRNFAPRVRARARQANGHQRTPTKNLLSRRAAPLIAAADEQYILSSSRPQHKAPFNTLCRESRYRALRRIANPKCRCRIISMSVSWTTAHQTRVLSAPALYLHRPFDKNNTESAFPYFHLVLV